METTETNTTPATLQGQRFNASDTFNRMFATDAVTHFNGLPTEQWVQIIERETSDYSAPSYSEHFHVNTDVGLGEIILYYQGRVGKGSLIRAGSDWQRVGLTSEGYKFNAHPYGAFMGEHWWDALIRGEMGAVASNMTPERQTQNLISVVNETIDEIVFLGDEAVGKMGIKRNPFISRVASTVRFNDVSQAQAIIDTVNNQMESASRINSTESAPANTVPNALLVPVDVMQSFNRRIWLRDGNGQSYRTSIREELIASGVGYIGQSQHMSRVGSTNGRGALLYRREQGNQAPVQVYQPLTLERLPIHWNGEENILKMFSAIHDVWFDYPDRTVLIENI